MSKGLSEERIGEIFDRIGEMNIELDDDPIERGPKFLNNMVALCRNYTNEVQKFARECQMYVRQLEHELRIAKADFEIQFNDLMANDPEICSLRTHSKADREAVANTRLKSEQEMINDLELSLNDLGHVNTVITSKIHELRDVNRDIRLQMQLIQAEIKTGSFWGNDHDFDAPHISPKDITSLKDDDVFEEDPEEDEDVRVLKPEEILKPDEEEYSDLDFGALLQNID